MSWWQWLLWGALVGFISQAPMLIAELYGLWKAKRQLREMK